MNLLLRPKAQQQVQPEPDTRQPMEWFEVGHGHMGYGKNRRRLTKAPGQGTVWR